MKRKRKNKSAKLGLIFIVLLFFLASTSMSYSLWYEELKLDIDIETTTWESGIKIMKTLDYLSIVDDIYTLTITVWNNVSSDLTDVEVTDTLGIDAIPISGSETLTHGYISWVNTPVTDGEINDLTWYIGNLLTNEIAVLTIDITVTVTCTGEEIASVVVYPEDGTTMSVPRYNHSTGDTGLGYYIVEHLYSSRAVRLENLLPNLGEDGLIQTDTFVITVLSGSTTVDVTITTKAGNDPPEGASTTIVLGETVTDILNFTLTFFDAVEIGGGLTEYYFYITSDDDTGTNALSHIDFEYLPMQESSVKCSMLQLKALSLTLLMV
jgi:hypothetical protein